MTDKPLQKIKAYIIYGGSPNWWNATLVFENGWAAFGHLCSSPGFMPGDLWHNRPERQEILRAMGYEVELVLPPMLSDGPDGLLEKHKDDSNWKDMAAAYERHCPVEV